MHDKEKIIKGLECHQIDNEHRINCVDCPYSVDNNNHIRCINDLHDDTISLLNEQEAAYQGAVELLRQKTILFDDAIKRLKEQEAVEPTLIREGRNKNYNDYVCPRCDNEVVYEQNYCSECGVRFLWEGR